MRKILTAVHWANDVKWLEEKGNLCWETICDVFPCDRPFTTDEATEAWIKVYPGSFSQRRREVHLVLKNVCAEWATVTDESPHLVKVGQSIWKLPSNKRQVA